MRNGCKATNPQQLGESCYTAKAGSVIIAAANNQRGQQQVICSRHIICKKKSFIGFEHSTSLSAVGCSTTELQDLHISEDQNIGQTRAVPSRSLTHTQCKVKNAQKIGYTETITPSCLDSKLIIVPKNLDQTEGQCFLHREAFSEDGLFLLKGL